MAAALKAVAAGLGPNPGGGGVQPKAAQPRASVSAPAYSAGITFRLALTALEFYYSDCLLCLLLTSLYLS